MTSLPIYPSIPTAILSCIISNCRHITNICIEGGNSLVFRGLHKFSSTLYNTLDDGSYIITLGRLTNFMEKSTPSANQY